MNIPRISYAEATDRHQIFVEFTDGSRKYYDVSPLLDREIFIPLRNIAFFKNFIVEPGGYAVSWNAEIDISEFELWQHGQELPKQSG
ncbi:conserved hypothetical protein [Gammaproteobacteria bacterium]